jgi:hypothetical protein
MPFAEKQLLVPIKTNFLSTGYRTTESDDAIRLWTTALISAADMFIYHSDSDHGCNNNGYGGRANT